MKKIPSLFKRNYETHIVYDEITEGCEWVIRGEGIPTRKFDGTPCMVKDGKLYKRFDMKKAKPGSLIDIEECIPCQPEPDSITGHWPFWIPVTCNPEDKYYQEAFTSAKHDGTYELCGPKINGNPEKYEHHTLVPHGCIKYLLCPTSFNEVRDYIMVEGIEGIVWHHPDGRMCKIKLRDFGVKRGVE